MGAAALEQALNAQEAAVCCSLHGQLLLHSLEINAAVQVRE